MKQQRQHRAPGGSACGVARTWVDTRWRISDREADAVKRGHSPPCAKGPSRAGAPGGGGSLQPAAPAFSSPCPRPRVTVVAAGELVGQASEAGLHGATRQGEAGVSSGDRTGFSKAALEAAPLREKDRPGERCALHLWRGGPALPGRRLSRWLSPGRHRKAASTDTVYTPGSGLPLQGSHGSSDDGPCTAGRFGAGRWALPAVGPAAQSGDLSGGGVGHQGCPRELRVGECGQRFIRSGETIVLTSPTCTGHY